MAYSATNFQDLPATSTPITGAELNKLGTQYSAAVAQVPAEVASTLADPNSAASTELSATIAGALTSDQSREAAAITAVAIDSTALSRNRLSTRAGYDSARSNGFSQAGSTSASSFTEAWAALTAWAGSAAQVSSGKLYGVTGGGGIATAFRVAPGQIARVVFKVNFVLGATSGQGLFIGFNRGAVGASPSAGGAQSRGLYFRSDGTGGTINELSDGVQGAALYSGLGASTWTVAVTVDESYLTMVATSMTGGQPRVVKRWARDDSSFPLNNLTIMINDARGLSGSSISPITEARNGALATGASLTGGITGHWGSDSGDNFLILLPEAYDSRKPTPAAILFHGNGSDEQHWIGNANGRAVADAFLTAGYMVIAAANTGAVSTWGAQVGLDAYVRAYQYARDHYNMGAVVLYGNSMGGIESLLTLAAESIPGVSAWMGTNPTFDLDENYANALFTTTIDAAYGGSYAGTTGRNPAKMPALGFRGVPMWMLVSTDDAAVTPAANGLALYAAVAKTNPRTKIETTGGHSTPAIASNAVSMVSWCNSILGLRNSWSA